jgi:hypothetical protein
MPLPHQNDDLEPEKSAKNRKKRFKLPHIPVLEDTNNFPKRPAETGIYSIEEHVQPPLEADKDTFAFLSQAEAFIRSISQKVQQPNQPTPVQNPETEHWAEQSLSENQLIASETLANLLALQGKPQKAIRMYEQLSLQNPEKQAFFQHKIEELKKKS